jgi:two-component system response regulator FixJ
MTDTGMVHIVDDDAAVRRSLALLLAAHGMAVRDYESAAALLAALPLAPGCAILDLRMPGMDGIALLEALRQRGCLLPAMIVSGHADVRAAVGAMKAGAVDVIEKPYSEPAILRAVRGALAQGTAGVDARLHDPAAALRVAVLTPRERDVLRGMVGGLPNKAIGMQLGISPRTVEIHRANLMEKLACRSLAEAVRLALQAGFAIASGHGLGNFPDSCCDTE